MIYNNVDFGMQGRMRSGKGQTGIRTKSNPDFVTLSEQSFEIGILVAVAIAENWHIQRGCTSLTTRKHETSRKQRTNEQTNKQKSSRFWGFKSTLHINLFLSLSLSSLLLDLSSLFSLSVFLRLNCLSLLCCSFLCFLFSLSLCLCRCPVY